VERTEPPPTEFADLVHQIFGENASVFEGLALSEARDKLLNVLKDEMRWQKYLNTRK
jgi:hypothetical protein